MQQQRVPGWFVVLFLAVTAPAWAGVVLEQQAKDVNTGEVTRIVMYVELGRLRIETQEAERTTIVIFRADRYLIWTIQPAEKAYYEMTQADVDRMAQQLAGMQKQQEEMLKQLPPEQRALAEQMMKQQRGGGQLANISVKRLGSETLGKFTTSKYEVLENGERSSEVWAAPLEQLNLQAAEYETFLQFGRFFEKLTQAAVNPDTAAVAFSGRWWESIQGFPAKVVSYSEGEATDEQQLVRAERQTFGNDKFELPPGLRKQQMPGMEA